MPKKMVVLLRMELLVVCRMIMWSSPMHKVCHVKKVRNSVLQLYSPLLRARLSVEKKKINCCIPPINICGSSVVLPLPGQKPELQALLKTQMKFNLKTLNRGAHCIVRLRHLNKLKIKNSIYQASSVYFFNHSAVSLYSLV